MSKRGASRRDFLGAAAAAATGLTLLKPAQADMISDLPLSSVSAGTMGKLDKVDKRLEELLPTDKAIGVSAECQARQARMERFSKMLGSFVLRLIDQPEYIGERKNHSTTLDKILCQPQFSGRQWLQSFTNDTQKWAAAYLPPVIPHLADVLKKGDLASYKEDVTALHDCLDELVNGHVENVFDYTYLVGRAVDPILMKLFPEGPDYEGRAHEACTFHWRTEPEILLPNTPAWQLSGRKPTYLGYYAKSGCLFGCPVRLEYDKNEFLHASALMEALVRPTLALMHEVAEKTALDQACHVSFAGIYRPEVRGVVPAPQGSVKRVRWIAYPRFKHWRFTDEAGKNYVIIMPHMYFTYADYYGDLGDYNIQHQGLNPQTVVTPHEFWFDDHRTEAEWLAAEHAKGNEHLMACADREGCEYWLGHVRSNSTSRDGERHSRYRRDSIVALKSGKHVIS